MRPTAGAIASRTERCCVASTRHSSTRPAGAPTTSPGPMLIGNQTGFTAGFFHRGAMSHHQFHNVVRDASYIAQYGVIGSIPALPDVNIIGNYPMDEGSGTTVDDTSLSDFNGTLTTATWI